MMGEVVSRVPPELLRLLAPMWAAAFIAGFLIACR
jgi:hypothetical protein